MEEKVFTHQVTLSFTDEEFLLIKMLSEYVDLPPEKLLRGPVRSFISCHQGIMAEGING